MTALEKQVSKVFAEKGKQFSGRSSSFIPLLPMLMGGVDGTLTGTTVWYNNTGKVVDDQYGNGSVKPNELVMITQVGNAERYTKYSTICISIMQECIGTTHSVFRLRKDACNWLEHARLEITVAEINELFKPW